ncbi:serine acetyltransferase [Microvirga tunisiensis]|jgi:serine O-acetyltransferase|uniref:Serine acetyltransferase n=1 Tax=Microvirga tunisiensis TaxID=2108360 RepID=A0A5N7MTD5_9HYPH|nr:serine acetyltransferase [Microvirga tunisiensis]MPR11733.1 serine acetyltransferase [Microvirga tunisiensis]MPR30261.1 serine acetyltransferase [Microvirga tunisiensis]
MQPDFWQLVREDLNTHFGQYSQAGFHALLMYRIGVEGRRRSGLSGILLNTLYKASHIFVRNFYGIEIHATSTIGRRVRIAHQGPLVVHEFAAVGDDCILRNGVTIGAASGPYLEQAPTLGRSVDIGEKAAIIGKVTIGDFVKVGPHCVVMKSLPSGTTVCTQSPHVMHLASAAAQIPNHPTEGSEYARAP